MKQKNNNKQPNAMKSDKIEIVEIKQYNTKQLAAIYGVDKKTFARWMKPFLPAIGDKNGYYFSIEQVKTIFDKLKLPSYVQIKDETTHFS